MDENAWQAKGLGFIFMCQFIMWGPGLAKTHAWIHLCFDIILAMCLCDSEAGLLGTKKAESDQFHVISDVGRIAFKRLSSRISENLALSLNGSNCEKTKAEQ